MKKYLNVFILILFIVVSCGKDDSLSRTEMISKAPWIMTASNYSPPYPTPDGSIVNGYAALPDYLKDDLYFYHSSGTYVHKEGETKYSPYDPDVWEFGIWAFSEDETMLYKGIINYINEYELLKLDGSELQIRYFVYDTLDNIYTVTETYIHP